jgi:hypothetical protein
MHDELGFGIDSIGSPLYNSDLYIEKISISAMLLIALQS